MLVSDLPVNHKIISKLETKNISTLTEIQERTMLPAIQGKDIIASSKTGSGKTFAFLVPAINRLMSQKALSKQDPRALILAPTRTAPLVNWVVMCLSSILSSVAENSIVWRFLWSA